ERTHHSQEGRERNGEEHGGPEEATRDGVSHARSLLGRFAQRKMPKGLAIGAGKLLHPRRGHRNMAASRERGEAQASWSRPSQSSAPIVSPPRQRNESCGTHHAKSEQSRARRAVTVRLIHHLRRSA